MLLIGRHTAWMIYEHSKICDTDGGVLEISDCLRSDCVKTFDTKWDETAIAMQTQPDEGLLGCENSDQLKQLVGLKIQDTVQVSELMSHTRFKRST